MLASGTASAVPAKITAVQWEDSSSYQRSVELELPDTTVRLLLNPSYVTADTNIYTEGTSISNYANQQYTGVVAGEKDSWARLALGKTTINGVYSSGGKRFELKTGRTGRISVKPLADNHAPVGAHQQIRKIQNTRATRVTRVAKIAIVVDSQYNETFDGAGVDKALSIINAVDGIYREEFGLGLKVSKVLSVQSDNDPFNYGAVPIEQMLRNFRDYRMNSQELTDVSLVHLFTGNKNTDEPVGLAWIDTACRTDGYDVGISTPYRHDILLAAHEIAHNLGAKHDSETACAAQQDKVMWPYISSNTSQYFSSCTLDAINTSLQNSCHTETIDLQVSLSSPDTNTISATVTNNDFLRSNPSATLSIDFPDNATATTLEGDCGLPTNDLECSIGTLLPGAQETIVVRFNQLNDNNPIANFYLENEESADPVPENNHVSINIRNGMIASNNPGLPSEVFPQTGGNAGAELKIGTGGFPLSALGLLACILIAGHGRGRAV